MKPGESQLLVRRPLVQHCRCSECKTAPIVLTHTHSSPFGTTHNTQHRLGQVLPIESAAQVERAVAERTITNLQHVMDTLQRHDRFAKGEIAPESFREALEECGIEVTDEEAKRLVPKYDLNK